MKSFKLTQHTEPLVLEAEIQHDGIPCMTEQLISDTLELERYIGDNDHIIFTSNHPAVFSTGGDIGLFLDAIGNRDSAQLGYYAHACIEAVNLINRGFGNNAYTIGCVEGDALGGGFEALLAMNLVIAAPNAKVGTPEALFGSFPGMGAISFLERKLGRGEAFSWVRRGRVVDAHKAPKKLVGRIAPEGGTLQIALATVTDRQRRNTDVLHRAFGATGLVPYDELKAVVDIWVDHMMRLDEKYINRMRAILRAQHKVYG